jgi:hypothetical protein
MVTRKSTKPIVEVRAADANANIDIFTWAGNGNLGDDWIYEVGSGIFPNSRAVREVWCKYPSHWGTRCLSVMHNQDSRNPILLWGGGWLASDQRQYRTLRRWRRHLQRAKASSRKVFGFGLGLGPFTYDLANKDVVLNALAGKLWVRSVSDLIVSAEANPKFASDCTLLQLNKLAAGPKAQKVWDYLICLPEYSSHWENQIEGLGNEKYFEIVDQIMSSIPPNSKIAFLESVNGDLTDWQSNSYQVLRPESPREMREHIASATCLVTARLHPGLMAAMSGLSVIAIAYHHKFNILEEFAIPVIWGIKNQDIADVTNAAKAHSTKLQIAMRRVEEGLEELITALNTND